jgi:hypothetical protein
MIVEGARRALLATLALGRFHAGAEGAEEGIRILEAETEALDRDREGAEATFRGRQEVEEDDALHRAVHEPALESKVGVDADRPHDVTVEGGSRIERRGTVARNAHPMWTRSSSSESSTFACRAPSSK